MSISRCHSPEVRVGALVAAMALLATVLAAVPRPANAQQTSFLTPSEPPSIAVDTMADCGEGRVGVRVENPIVEGAISCTGVGAGEPEVVLVRIDRTNGEVVESCVGCGIGTFLAGQGTNMLVVVSSPSTLRTFTDDVALLQGWGLAATNALTAAPGAPPYQADFEPFSAVVIPGCTCAARINQHAIADATFGSTLRAGRLQGQLQRSADGHWTYVEGDFLAFDTLAGPDEAPVIRMGEADVPLPGVDLGTDGIALATFDAATGAVVDAPEVFPMSGTGVSALSAALVDLEEDISNGMVSYRRLRSDLLVVVQSVGRPVAARSSTWEDVSEWLELNLGATKTRLLSLNRPDTAGTEIPTGYTLIGRYRPAGSQSLESVQQGSGQRVHLVGQLSRTSDSLLSPLTADAYGLTDPELFEVAFAPPSGWPIPSSDPAMVWLRDELIPRGYPAFEDVRTAYWATINEVTWLNWAEAVAGIEYEPGSGLDEAAFEQARTAFHGELLAVHRVQSVLVSPSSLVYRVLTELTTDLSESIQTLADQVIADLPRVPPPPSTFVKDLIYAILSVATAALGPASTVAKGALDATEEVLEMVQDFGKVLGVAVTSMSASGLFAGGGGEPGSTPFEEPVRREANQVAQTLAKSVSSARSSLGQLAGLIVSDHGRLAAAAEMFQSPRYVVNNPSAVSQATNVARAGAQGTVLRDILEVAYATSSIEGSSTTAPVAYPIGSGCTEPVAGSVQTLTVGYTDNGSAERQAVYLRPKYAEAPNLNTNEPETSPALLALLFSPYDHTVTYGGGQYPGSGLVPATFFPLLDDETERAADTLCGIFAQEGDISGWGQWAPGAAMQVMYGAGSATPVADAHDVIHVRVSDSAGNAVSGVEVTLSLGADGPFAHVGGDRTPTAVTGPAGVAQFGGITAGSPGTFTAVARVDHAGARLAEDIRLTNLAYTSVMLSADPPVSGTGQPVTFRADVPSEIPVTRGHVTFLVDGVEQATIPVAADASAAWTASDLAVGEHVVTARYSGSAAHVPSTGTLDHTVSELVSPSVTVTGPAEAPAGQDVTFTATVASPPSVEGTRGGTVDLSIDGEAEPSCTELAVSWVEDSGTAACTLSFDDVGEREVVASFSGDDQLAPSASPVITHTTVEVPVEMSLAYTGDAVAGGQIVVTASLELPDVAPGLAKAGLAPAAVAPDGTVAFDLDGEPIDGCDAAPVTFTGSDGKATCSVSLPAAGTHELRGAFTPSGSPLAAKEAVLRLVVAPPDRGGGTGGSTGGGSTGGSTGGGSTGGGSTGGGGAVIGTGGEPGGSTGADTDGGGAAAGTDGALDGSGGAGTDGGGANASTGAGGADTGADSGPGGSTGGDASGDSFGRRPLPSTGSSSAGVVPAAAWLILAGLVLLAASAWRRRGRPAEATAATPPPGRPRDGG